MRSLSPCPPVLAMPPGMAARFATAFRSLRDVSPVRLAAGWPAFVGSTPKLADANIHSLRLGNS